MPLRFSLRAKTTVPLEVEGITPDGTRGKSLAEIEKLEIFEGNVKTPLAAFFNVRGDSGDGVHEWEGDLAGVHWIGTKMEAGKIVVEGNAGRHLGSEMRGGEIHVQGTAGDWVGGEGLLADAAAASARTAAERCHAYLDVRHAKAA